MRFTKIIILFLFCSPVKNSFAQDTSKPVARSMAVMDSTVVKINSDTAIVKKDSTVKPRHDPNKATIRSAILPGWGQAYNREYWKIPIVYAAIGIPAGLYIYNNTWYKRFRDAYTITINNDTAHFTAIYPKIQNFSAESLQYYRNQFRRDRDYSVLYFLIMWGLNVVDATVFGHLKDFDVSDNLSMNISPQYNPSAKSAGIGIVLNLKTPQHKQLSLK